MKRFLVAALLCCGCNGTTGGALVSFAATASGPAEVTAPFTFTTGFAQVTLTGATLHLGAVYLNQSVPTSGAAEEPCVLPGTYVAEAFGPLDVDLLSADPQGFPQAGEGTATAAKTAEVWLSGGDVNAAEDPTVILSVAGSAVQNGMTIPFSGAVTIGSNRASQTTNPAMPGANPICHKRIVSPISLPDDLVAVNLGTLAITIDPRGIFAPVDFSSLMNRVIPDTTAGASGQLYKGLFANTGVYSFAFHP
jgi:hypothetical protein